MLTENSCSKLSISTSHDILSFSSFPRFDLFKIKVFYKAIYKANCNILQNFSLKLKLASEVSFSFCIFYYFTTHKQKSMILCYSIQDGIGERLISPTFELQTCKSELAIHNPFGTGRGDWHF